MSSTIGTVSSRAVAETATSSSSRAGAEGKPGSAGAAAHVCLYLTRYNEANRQNRIELLDGLFTSACEDCVALRSKVAARLAKGITPNGDIFTVNSVEAS